jgi:hypothetical protein
MPMQDKTWDVRVTLRVTTMAGWEPDREDIEGWLETGGAFEPVTIDEVKEATA